MKKALTPVSRKVILCLDGKEPLCHFPHLRFALIQTVAILLMLVLNFGSVFGQAAASFNYDVTTGNLGTTYSWIDCSSGADIVSGDDEQATISWPFEFAFYDNIYSTSDNLSVCTNGFIRLDGVANTSYTEASAYNLTATATNLGQIIAMAVYDGNVGDNGGWVRSLVTGSSPNRVFTIEYNNLEIDYNDGLYTDVQVSFYETSYNVVLKLGADDINKSGVDMGIHSGVNDYFNKWQEVLSGTNNTWVEYIPTEPPDPPEPPAASWNYDLQTGTLGATYSWIDCSSGNSIVSGDDAQAQINWPFEFSYYDNTYSTDQSLSVCSNGFIRLDGLASTDYDAATTYDLTSTATNLGQIIAIDVYDGNVSTTSWVRSVVTGTAPNRIFTIEYNNHEIDYNDGLYANAQVSFYESSNKIVLKLGTDNIDKSGVDMGLHSGVETYFNKWQEVLSGTNNTWIEYLPPYVEVTASIGSLQANYFSLKSAFDKINDGTHQGDITIEINNSTIETATASLNYSGNGSANYNFVNIYPTKSGLSVSGELSAPLIDLNGADNVTIDGRVNATGTQKDLSIINTSTASDAGTSAIRLRNDASNNTVKFCTIKASEARASSGVIYLATTNASTGNDDNIISNNDITCAETANRPFNAVYSNGTTGKDNSGNIISDNNIYDFIRHASASYGINLASDNTSWTITGNSFYETTSFSPTGTVTYMAIRINGASGNDFVISDNFIGGSEPLSAGTAWTKVNTTNNLYTGIYLNVGTTTTSSVQNNTIKNFDWSNSGNAEWSAIKVVGGNVDIGTTTANEIGETTGINSIRIAGGTNGNPIYGIKISGSGEVNCSNNNIGSITGLTASDFATHIYGIHMSGSPIMHVENNTIGSTTTGSSIHASSASLANAQKIQGIFSSSSATTYIHNNTIVNLKNNTSNTATGTRGHIDGIKVTAGINTITENTIRDLSNANANASRTNASVVGVLVDVNGEAQTVEDNMVYNLSNTYSSFTGCVIGFYSTNDAGAAEGTVNANFIHSLTVNAASAGAEIYGMYVNSDNITYSNNIISIGGSSSSEVFGIYDRGLSTKPVKFYFNTIYIAGTNSGSDKSYCLRYNTNSNTRDSRNNIFFNARSGGTGGHFAIYYDGTGGTFTADYNDYFANGTGGVLAYFGGDQSTLAALQTATSQDANSLNINPVFSSPGGTNSEDYVTAVSLPGVDGTGVTVDYDGVSRSNPPKMGALESSLSFVWQGNTSTDFATATNWENGSVPPNGSDISFATTPANDCYLDQNRTLSNITNTSSNKLVLNANQLTISGSIVSATANQIDASAVSSSVTFAGHVTQIIPSGVFVSNTINALTLNNDHGLTQNGNLILQSALVLTDGVYSIGANTMTINGAVSVTSGSLIGGNTSNIIIGGSGASTTLPGILLNNLTVNRADGISLGGSVGVNGSLTLTNGTLTLGSNTLSLTGNTLTRTSGNIDASDVSATFEFLNSTAITLPASLFAGNINNLTIDGGGITSAGNLTVNGVLDLPSANPSATKGLLDMLSDTLNMGGSSSTTGTGDVTGIVRREHAFTISTSYTFGSQFTNFTFVDSNTKPEWICVEISIGSVPPWTPWTPSPDGKVKRLYKVSCSDNSSIAQAAINMRYLLSELDPGFNEESKLIFWHKFSLFGGGLPHEHGKASQDFINHSIGVVGLPFGAVSTTDLDDSQVAIAYSLTAKNTWKGDVVDHETEWEQPQNWTAGTVPLSTDNVLIPGGLTYYPSLTASSNAVANTIEMEAGASITANSYDITVSGAGGAWINYGTLYPGTGNVLFDHGILSEIVTVSGNTNFYDIEVGPNTTMQPVPGNILRIAGVGIADMTSIVDFSTINNTVEWNGANQTIVNPNGISGNSGYFKLILSGSGTKTMPTTAMNIADELKLDGTVSVTAQAPLSIGAEFEILDNASFATGNYDHTVGGHFDNRGTFVASIGTKISLNGTTMQEIYGGSPTTFEKLTINNPAGIEVITGITVDDTLFLSSGNLNIESTKLVVNGAVTKTSGFLNTTNQSSLSFGGTAALSLASNIFFTTPSIDTLTINRTGGLALGGDITVNGELNLQSANPSGTIGSLDMGNDTIFMGATATTIGPGDVTGFVKRTTILPEVEYTFGNEFTSVTFPNIGTLPSEITIRITIGTVPTWKSDAVARIYDLAHRGGNGTRAVIKGHYKDGELNGNTEEDLIDITYIIPYSLLIERGRSEINTVDNWISLNNADFGNLAEVFGFMELGFSESTTNVIRWDGSVSTDWLEPTNWTPAYMPDSTKLVVIPDTATTPRDPILPDSSTISTLTIQADGLLTAISGSVLILKGSAGAWANNGTFNPSTGKVVFDHGDNSNIATISGTTNFYNIEAGENTTLQPVAGNIMRIAGTGIAGPTSVVDFSTENSTVEWNGTNQTIVYPIGIAGSSGFNNLILSNSGTKTLPDTTLLVRGNFTMHGTASTTAADSIIISGNANLGSGTAFGIGSHKLLVGGDFENSGTFTTATGSFVTFNGDTVQSISGTSSISFHSICILNDTSVVMEQNVTIIDSLALCAGPFHIGANTLTINGGISNASGDMVLNSNSSLVFGGTSAITLNNNLFNGNPTINNLTINRSGGVTLGNEGFTVNGTLTLTSGTLTIAANTLNLATNMAVRTSGNIDASNIGATVSFGNNTASSFPVSLFTGSINNLEIYGIGGITAVENLTVNGVLTLGANNPTSTKGILEMDAYTLDMGPTSTTIGQGDVSGIIRRTSISTNTTYTMGNEYTSIYFPTVGTIPTEISLKVTLGTTPSWKTGAINRIYDFIQTGGTGTQAILQSHYLDSELNGNDENKLVEWLHIFALPLTIEYGRSAYNTAENWVAVSHVNVGVFSSVFGEQEIVMDEHQIVNLTWNGSTSSSWITATNWTPTGAPSDETVVTIPDSSTTPNDPLIPVLAICGKMIIEPGGFLHSVSDGKLTLMGSDSAWVNNGAFAPGTGSINFANGDETDTVKIFGNNNFYNLGVSDKTFIQPGINSVTNIAGQLDADPHNCTLDFSSNPNLVEYNGDKTQYVVSPRDGYGYDNLIFSGSGTKVLAADTLKILGDLTIDTTISATGNTVLMAGTSAQNIGGITGDTLGSLTVDNTAGVSLTNTGITTISGTLLINSGKKFLIPATQRLTVAGSISNNAGNGGLYLYSDATGTASLIHNNNNIEATVERYITGSAEDWHFLSSPVSDQEISGSWLPSGTYGNGTGYDLYLWNEPTSCWIYNLNTTTAVNWNTVHPGADFETGRGYLYSVQAANPTKSFVGDLNNGIINYGLTINGTDVSVQGFNLVGNPYASSIDWAAAFGWTHNDLVESGGGYNMWIWNPTANNYGVYNSADTDGIGTNSITRYIAPMQGFFVEAANAGNLGYSNSIRVHNGANDWFKNQQLQTDYLNLSVSGDAGFGSDEILLEFGYQTKEIGAKKLFSHVTTAPSLYINSTGTELSVGYYTTPEETQRVSVDFTSGTKGVFTISCEFDTKPFDLIWLEDRKEKFFVDLMLANEYSFSADPLDDASRFVLHFHAAQTPGNEELPAHIYSDGNEMVIDLSLVEQNATVQLVDMLGRVIDRQEIQGKTKNRIDVPVNTQIVLVNVSTSNASISRKVFVNKL